MVRPSNALFLREHESAVTVVHRMRVGWSDSYPVPLLPGQGKMVQFAPS